MSVTWFLVCVLGHFYFALFFHSFYLHRYTTHKQFELSGTWNNVFFFMTWIAQGTAFLNPRSYKQMHLRHHLFSDVTGMDPHTPKDFSVWKYGLDFFIAIPKMTWETKNKFIAINKRKIEILKIQNKKIPGRYRFEIFTDSWISLLLFLGFYIWFYVSFAPNPWFWFLFPLTIFSGPIQGAVVNWFGHMWGYRNHPHLKDNSRNTPVVAILFMGEPNQNNHHNNPHNPNFADKWYEFDLVYQFIKLFDLVGIVRLPPKTT